MLFDAVTLAVIAAVSGAISAAATAVTAVIAIVALMSARRDSRDRSRPLVVVELQKEPFAKGTVNLVVRNDGASPARDVRVSFSDAPTPGRADDLSDPWVWIRNRYADPVGVLTPRSRLVNVVKFGVKPDVAPFVVDVSYNGVNDKPGSTRRRYRDTFPLDPEMVANHTEAGPSDTSSDSDHRKRTARAIEVLARSVYTGQ